MELKVVQASRWARLRAIRALYRLYRNNSKPYRVDFYVIQELYRKFQGFKPEGPVSFKVELTKDEVSLVEAALSCDPANLLKSLGEKKLESLKVS